MRLVVRCQYGGRLGEVTGIYWPWVHYKNKWGHEGSIHFMGASFANLAPQDEGLNRLKRGSDMTRGPGEEPERLRVPGKCIGRGTPETGCGGTGMAGEICENCGGMLLSEKAIDDVKKLMESLFDGDGE